ncbi:hypothetical protein MtrunA17_Chr3g0108801 [Medicago truncatula]|uniref:Uncharacterized protein n=1 Tax=Medicago truncatula TaxID=3880 RepID=A0A396IQG9_MEDTR|nr:hypothetical protein MtrunA17_Chr3g0108801 [Medicago truncatula]
MKLEYELNVLKTISKLLQSTDTTLDNEMLLATAYWRLIRRIVRTA